MPKSLQLGQGRTWKTSRFRQQLRFHIFFFDLVADNGKYVEILKDIQRMICLIKFELNVFLIVKIVRMISVKLVLWRESFFVSCKNVFIFNFGFMEKNVAGFIALYDFLSFHETFFLLKFEYGVGNMNSGNTKCFLHVIF